jgi:TP901 family phage tail tape measure protein
MATQFSPDQAVEGLRSLTTAGQTATQATRTLLPVLDLATGSLGQLDVADAADAVVGTLNAYGMAADRATGVTDRLLRVTQLTNFQTRDFEAGLSKAAATGAVFGQHLDDVLITMGLLRNRNIDASSSATAFREATRRVGAESRAQEAILGAGVDIFDKTSGRMRSIVDIMQDFARSTEEMTQKERNRRVVTAFGARGLLAFNAILNASYTTTRNGAEVTYQGAQAIEELRRQMFLAEGTAQDFRNQLLDTFEGQKTLITGAAQTLAVVMGEPFTQALRPVVGAVYGMLNSLVALFQGMPGPIKKAFAVFTLAGGAMATLVGVAIATVAAFSLLAPVIQVVAAAAGSVATALVPAIAIVGVLGAAVAGLSLAFRRNLGGLGDVAQSLGQKLQLAFRSVAQLFEQGGFSGAVREELARAENQGLRGFVVRVWQLVHRLRQVWTGFTSGLATAIEQAQPIFQDFAQSLRDWGGEIGRVVTAVTGSATALPSSRFAAFGQAIGRALAGITPYVTKFLAVWARVGAGTVAGFRSMMTYLRPAVETLRLVLGELGEAWTALIGATQNATVATNDSTESWRSLGSAIGHFAGGALTLLVHGLTGALKWLAVFIRVQAAVKGAFDAVGSAILAVGSGLERWFSQALPNAIRAAAKAIAGFLGQVGQSIATLSRWLPGLGGFSVDASVSPVTAPTTAPASANQASPPAFVQAMPAVTELRSRSVQATQLETVLAELSSTRRSPDGQPITINLEVDGETLARVTHNAGRDLAARSFTPVPTY